MPSCAGGRCAPGCALTLCVGSVPLRLRLCCWVAAALRLPCRWQGQPVAASVRVCVGLWSVTGFATLRVAASGAGRRRATLRVADELRSSDEQCSSHPLSFSGTDAHVNNSSHPAHTLPTATCYHPWSAVHPTLPTSACRMRNGRNVFLHEVEGNAPAFSPKGNTILQRSIQPSEGGFSTGGQRSCPEGTARPGSEATALCGRHGLYAVGILQNNQLFSQSDQTRSG